MTLKQDLQNLNNRLDKQRSRFSAAEERGDVDAATRLNKDIEKLTQKIESLKEQLSKKMSSKGQGIKSLKFSRPITKAEQADMGKLKKSVRGLVVVHPMTALGKEMGLDVMTGYAPVEF